MIPISRRGFLAASALAASPALAHAAARTPVVDTHLHCFAGPASATFPYHKEAPYTPDAATPEHLLRCMADGGVDHAIVVHPEPYQDDHRYLEHCLAVGKGKLKGTCLFFADREDTPKRLAELAKRLPLVAARVHAYNPYRLPPFGQPGLKALWKAAGAAGIAVQLHFEPRWAEGFEALIAEFKDVRVFVDHLGRPLQGAPKEYERILGWARYPNVIVKFSAVPSRRNYPHREVGREAKQLTDAFGPDRLMYGGGFGASATGASYRTERERIAGLLAHLSETDRAKIFGGTAAKIMGFAV